MKFIGNTGLLFTQILVNDDISTIDPTNSISWTAPQSSDAEVYNNSGILQLYNITAQRNTIYIVN